MLACFLSNKHKESTEHYVIHYMSAVNAVASVKSKDEDGYISPEAVKRIASDVRDLMRSPIDNCLYIHDPKNIMRGYAMVIGTEDTPYNCVPMLYVFDFPSDYPHSPPKLTFKTYAQGKDKHIRLHPNYYVKGKCCLSILNTWRGEPWSGCQTIRSILNTIQMTLTSYPLENEPGVNGNGVQGQNYRTVIYNAGLNIIYKFLNGLTMTRITNDDEVNTNVLDSFKQYLIKYLSSQNGKAFYQSLIMEESQLNCLLLPQDKLLFVTFYNDDYIVNYSEIRELLCSFLPTINVEN